MSNFLAIATVTATLQRMLQQSVQLDVDGARISTSRPDNAGGTPETTVNLYLYHIKQNAAWSNTHHPNAVRRGTVLKQNMLALDLFYLIAFYGNENELEPHRLLGSTVKTLEDKSLFSKEMINETINDPTFSFLLDSDLADQAEIIRSEFVPISTEELSKVWSVFFQTPYALSIVYKVTVVLLEGEEPSKKSLPVLSAPRVSVSAIGQQPSIEMVFPVTGKAQPILANSTLVIKGKHLATTNTLVRVGKCETTPTIVNPNEIRLSLTAIPIAELRAGIQSLQIIYASPSRSNRTRSYYAQSHGAESNVVPIVIRPTITEVTVSNVEGDSDDPRKADLTITTLTPIGKGQRLLILLNERILEEPSSYIFTIKPPRENTNTVTFKVKGIKSGEYFLRIQVDGAESVLELERSPNNITNHLPIVIIP